MGLLVILFITCAGTAYHRMHVDHGGNMSIMIFWWLVYKCIHPGEIKYFSTSRVDLFHPYNVTLISYWAMYMTQSALK